MLDDHARLVLRAWYRERFRIPATHSTPNFAEVSAVVEKLIDAGRARIENDVLSVDDDSLDEIPRPGMTSRGIVGLPSRAFEHVPGLESIDDQVRLWRRTGGERGLSPGQAEQLIADVLDEHPNATRHLSSATMQALPRPTRLIDPPFPDGVLIRLPAYSAAGFSHDAASALVGEKLNVAGVDGVIVRAEPSLYGDAIDVVVQFPRELRFGPLKAARRG